jgi:hypothetical protein
MTTQKTINRSSGSSSPSHTTEVPTRPGVVHPKETEKSIADQVETVANRMAHKANKRQQDYDRENTNLFTK